MPPSVVSQQQQQLGGVGGGGTVGTGGGTGSGMGAGSMGISGGALGGLVGNGGSGSGGGGFGLGGGGSFGGFQRSSTLGQSRLRPNSPQPFSSSSLSSSASSTSSYSTSSHNSSSHSRTATPPPMTTEIKEALATRIPLRRHWVFWHDRYVANATPEQYTDNLKPIADLNSVQTFWSIYNNIAGPERLTLRCSLHFMYQGVKPLWEDPRNEHGGCWKFRIAKADVAEAWRELLMALVGEQFEDSIAPGDEILGLSVSARWNSDIFQIWNLQSSLREENNTVMEKVAEILRGIEIQSPFYKAHKDHDDFQKIYDHRDGLMNAIRDNGILVIIGETGSGKTTQLPRYVIEEFRGMRVGVTQPRRIAAISVAKRVAEEYDCRVGDTVGYTVRFDDNTSSRTRLKYMTDGVLLREATMDPLLEKYDLLIIDEAHERTVETDVLFGLLKRTKAKRPNLKLLIMSATLNVEKFSDYFDECPIYDIPGRTYDVEILHSRDSAKLRTLKPNYLAKSVDTVMHILNKEVQPGEVGDILVFLTGQHEIERACQDLKMAVLEKGKEDSDSSRTTRRNLSLDQLQILPLYASLELLDQAAIFGPTPAYQRKVIFATNIAQTSVTIPNIRFVVDCGFVKQKMYDSSTGMDALLVVPISKAAATQRSGRAGRTRDGICFRLYSRESFEAEMEAETVPEIMRTGLTGTVLSLKKLGIVDVNGFEFLDRPRQEELQAALRELYLIGGIDRFGQMTEVGQGMVVYPVNPLLARSLVEAEKLGCLEKAIIIVAMLSVEEPFYLPRKEEEQDTARAAHAQFYHPSGDHVTLLNVFEAWREASYSKEWCHDNYFNIRQLRLAKNIRSQLRDIVDRQSLHDKDAQQPHFHHDNPPKRSSSPSRRGEKSSSSKSSSQSSSSSRTILEAFSQGYGIHLSKKHPHRSMFYHYLASTMSSSSGGQHGNNSSLLALHVSPLSALYLDEERSMTKQGRKVARDLEWVVYHEVVYHVRAVMRYVSKIDLRWVQETTMERVKIYDQGAVWLNGERTELPSLLMSSTSEALLSKEDITSGSGVKRFSGETSENGVDTAEEKKRARLELVEAARKRALERRQNQS
ncbi:DEAH-box ATP-dependent RNA helicase prp22 [Gryganskiella cystojenkinii]|nr:DEAH-box ATP-dependent RNA helicase prp22 [Gryganskiella cystojenkinii]